MSRSNLRALLIDLSGTLHVGDEPTRGAVAALKRLRDAGLPVRFCSNTTKESRGSLLSRLRRIGFDVEESELFTSLSAVKSLVQKRNLRPLLLLSESAQEDFRDIPGHDPNAVVVGLAPSKLSYLHLNHAFRLLTGEGQQLEQGSPKPPLVATHRALYLKDEDNLLSLGPGGFISALEQAANVTAEVVGKPSRSFFEICLQSLEREGITNEEWPNIGMIGDDWRNDLGEGAEELHLKRYLVRTGKYREGDEDRASALEGVHDNFASLVDSILA